MTSAESVVPAGGLKKMISDEHGVDLTYFGPGWRCTCGMVPEGDLVEHIVEVTEMEIALTARDLTRALVGYVADAMHRENSN